MESLATRLHPPGALRCAGAGGGKALPPGEGVRRSLTPLRIVASEAASPAQRDRAHWYIIDALFAMNVPDVAAAVSSEAGSWSDPTYFTDILQKRIAELVTARSGRTLVGLWRSLDTSGPDEVRAQLSYVLAKGVQEGAITGCPERRL